MLTTTYTPLPGTTDGASGSLRADIALANADTGSQPDIIQLAAGDYDLTSASGQLAITNTTHTLIIEGAGIGSTTIDQHFADRVFNVAAGATVLFENLEITGHGRHRYIGRNDGGRWRWHPDLHAHARRRRSRSQHGVRSRPPAKMPTAVGSILPAP